jgi:hypothetical protein
MPQRGRSDVIRQIRDDHIVAVEERRRIDLEDVRRDHIHVVAAQRPRQLVIEFDRHNALRRPRQTFGEHTEARADLEHFLRGFDLCRRDDAIG